MLMKIAGRVRGLFAGNYPENREEEQLHINTRGDQIVAQGLTELVRMGDSWQVISTTGQAALTALPTTTSGLTLNNNEKATGKCYAIDSFGSAEEVIDATQTDVTGLFAMLNKTGSAQGSGGTAETGIRSLSGKTNYGGSGVLLRGATVANDSWFPHGTPGAQMAAAAAGANWKVNEALVRGLYLVPPGGSFSVQAVKAAAAAAAQQFFFIRWHEVQILYKS
jgi:hypothetical protein